MKVRGDFDITGWVLLAKKSGSFDISKSFQIISFV
jgi:hypothetical protein